MCARVIPFALLLGTLALGIASRRVHAGWSLWDKSAGDVLYAVAVYLALVVVAPRRRPALHAGLALAICLALELFQRTPIPREVVHQHPWAAWLLGTTFAWHDVVCYAIGVGVAALIRRRARA